MDSTNHQPEGVDGTEVLFRERLWPGIGICAFLSAMTISLGIAYGHAYGPSAGLLVGIGTTVLLVGSLFVNAPVVCVDNLVVRAGKARLPLRYTGEVRRLDRNAGRAAIRNNVNHQAYLLVRSWISDSLVITVIDTTDPHPYWQISSRRSKALLAAIESAKIKQGAPNE
jgi:hypothetical protein